MTATQIAICLTAISLGSFVWFICAIPLGSNADDDNDALIERIAQGDCRLADILERWK